MGMGMGMGMGMIPRGEEAMYVLLGWIGSYRSDVLELELELGTENATGTATAGLYRYGRGWIL